MPSRTIAIFDALIANLTGLPTTAGNVKKSRAYSVNDSLSSALTVRIGGETILEWNAAKVRKAREFRIVIHAAAAESAIDDIVQQIEAEIWAALNADVTQGIAYVEDTEFSGSAEIEIEPGARATARLEHTWTVHYTHSTTSMES
jgi:hypothetical protein